VRVLNVPSVPRLLKAVNQLEFIAINKNQDWRRHSKSVCKYIQVK